MKPDQERVKNLLTDTVTLLCKNGLTFSKELRVEGLLGITTDSNDVFLVHINEAFGENGERIQDITSVTKLPSSNATDNVDSPQSQRSTSRPSERPPSRESMPSPKNTPQKSSHLHSNSNHRRTTQSPSEAIRIKQEAAEDVIVLDPKSEHSFSPCAQTSRRTREESNTSGLELSVDNVHGSYEYDTDGEPPSKRRTMGSETGDDSGSGGDSMGAYITGMVRNVHDKPDTSQSQGTTAWPSISANLNLSSEIAAQMAQAAMAQGDNSLSGLDTSMPGCSTWPGAQNMGGSPGQGGDMYLKIAALGITGHQQRGTSSSRIYGAACNRLYPCPVPGCGKVYNQRQSRHRHKRMAHGLSDQGDNQEIYHIAQYNTNTPTSQ